MSANKCRKTVEMNLNFENAVDWEQSIRTLPI